MDKEDKVLNSPLHTSQVPRDLLAYCDKLAQWYEAASAKAVLLYRRTRETKTASLGAMQVKLTSVIDEPEDTVDPREHLYLQE